jgi:hypothetical protein
MNKILSSLAIVFVFFFGTSCIQEIEQFGGGVTPLIVTGELTNEPKVHSIRLLVLEGFNVRPDFQKVNGVDVRVIDDLGNEEQYSQIGNGFFESSEDFAGVIGRTYHTRMVFPDGKIYESEPELMADVPTLTKITATATNSDMLYSVDFEDPIEKDNFYRWRFLGTYEVFSQFAGERFGGADFNPRLNRCYPANIYGNPYANCWITDFDQNFLFIEDDKLINGRYVTDKPVYQNNIDIKFDVGYSAQIKLYSLSKKAYNYWSEVNNQLGNTGTIFETSNYQLLGNVKSVSDPEEVVLGYFQVSAVSSIRAFTDTYQGTFPPRDCEANEGGCRPVYCVSCLGFGPSSSAIKPDFWPGS